MRAFGAFEAKNKLGHLLDLVEAGEVVVITRHGKPVAQLSRPTPVRDRDAAARAAAQRIRTRAQSLRLDTFDWQEWKAYRDDERP